MILILRRKVPKAAPRNMMIIVLWYLNPRDSRGTQDADWSKKSIELTKKISKKIILDISKQRHTRLTSIQCLYSSVGLTMGRGAQAPTNRAPQKSSIFSNRWSRRRSKACDTILLRRWADSMSNELQKSLVFRKKTKTKTICFQRALRHWSGCEKLYHDR